MIGDEINVDDDGGKYDLHKDFTITLNKENISTDALTLINEQKPSFIKPFTISTRWSTLSLVPERAVAGELIFLDRCWMIQDAGLKMQDAGCKMQDAGFKMQDAYKHMHHIIQVW